MSSELESPTRTIVTGAGGWLGRALASELADAAEPVRLAIFSADESAEVQALAPNAETVLGDLTKAAVFDALLRDGSGADLIHVASVIHPEDPADFERVNVGLARSLVEAATESGIRRFVYVSSNSPFGFNPSPEDRFRGDDAYSPWLGYGRSKMKAELLVKGLAGSGVEFVIVRPPWFYGPFQPERQTEFFRTVRKGLFPLVGNGSNLRSMVAVDSLARGIRQAQLAEAAAGRAYWLSDAEPYEFRHVVETVQQALELEGLSSSHRALRLPHAASSVARAVDRALQERGRYSQAVHVMGELDMNIACSPADAQRDFGFEPATDLLEGMRRSIAWALANGADL